MGSKKKASVSKPKVKAKVKIVEGTAKPYPIRISVKQLRALRIQAKKYAQGNLSAWLRHAGLRYIPKRGEVVETVPMPGTGRRSKKKR